MKFDNHTQMSITYMDTYIHIKVEGIITMESSYQNFLKINAAIEEYDCHRLLLENNYENALALEDTLEIHKRMVEHSILNVFNSKNAFVVKEDQFESFKTYESMLNTLNVDVKVFTDKSLAMQWLV